jgi:hypothetical protein
MKKMSAVILAVMMVLGLALSGCAGQEEPTEGAMEVWGYVASADKAQLELDENQDGVNELVVDRVLSPGDAWIVVHADDNGKPGMRVGIAHIDKGESTNVKVKLEDLTTPKVIVAVHADKGTADEYDFDMMNKEMSPDRPYFVDGAELAKVVVVREFGIPTEAGTAAIEVADQPGVKGELLVARAVAPAGAWIVVHLDDDGAPGARVGLLHIPAGENTNVAVALDPLPLTDKLFVAVHADAGTPDVFDFDMMNKINSADQPYFVGEEEVATAVTVR